MSRTAARWLRPLLPLLLFTLSGCATLREPTPADASAVQAAWTARQQQLAAVAGFEASGRVAVKGGGLSGALRWQQQGEQFQLRIAGPFGAGALSMEGTPARVRIKGKDIDLVTDQPAQVLAARTGWRLPLDALRWWVLGLPAPAADDQPPSVQLDADGRAESLQQGGWQLQYSDYRGDGATALPARIEASQPTPAGEWKATVVLDRLTLTP